MENVRFDLFFRLTVIRCTVYNFVNILSELKYYIIRIVEALFSYIGIFRYVLNTINDSEVEGLKIKHVKFYTSKY